MFRLITNYISFLKNNKNNYLTFNKQLVFAEVAGLIAGWVVAELSNSLSRFNNSLYSGLTDYFASMIFFFIIYYMDNKKFYLGTTRFIRIKKIVKSAISIWPSIIIADIAYLFVRPYFHYILMTILNLETGLAAIIAHFFAFGVFNVVAIISKSVIDYVRQK